MEQILKTLGTTFLSIKDFGFVYGIQGTILRRNFERIWFRDVITMSKYNIFLVPPNAVIANINEIIDIGLDNVPFGIAEIDDVNNTWNNSLCPKKSQFKHIKHKIARVTTIYETDDSVENSKDLFYKKQRERKSWWRKISENPANYNLIEGKQTSSSDAIEIEAQFPFGNIVVESIRFQKSAFKLLPRIKKNSHLKIVEHVTSLDWGCLALLCDGYIEIEGSKELQMHPSLHPYKAYCKATIAPEDDEIEREDLNDLTLYVIELLREKGVESIIMNNVQKPEVFRVPYIVNINSDSLKSGLVKLTCQRTLCGETVHITNLAQRLYDLCF